MIEFGDLREFGDRTINSVIEFSDLMEFGDLREFSDRTINSVSSVNSVISGNSVTGNLIL